MKQCFLIFFFTTQTIDLLMSLKRERYMVLEVSLYLRFLLNMLCMLEMSWSDTVNWYWVDTDLKFWVSIGLGWLIFLSDPLMFFIL